MNFRDIKKLDENVDFSKIHPYDWDLVIRGIPYYVCRIEGYCHSISWRDGTECIHDLWCYPRHEEPSLENLVEYDLKDPVAWGISYDEVHTTTCRHGDSETVSGARAVITRNGVPFHTVFGERQYAIPKAMMLIAMAQEHPLDFGRIGYAEKMIGRKVWFSGQPAIIESYVEGQCCVILRPEGADRFKVEPEFVKDYGEYYEDGLKIDCLESCRVWWFRD